MATTTPLQQETLLNRNLEVVRTGVIASAVGAAGTLTTATLTHNLGYVPILLAFIDTGTTLKPLPAVISNSLASTYIQDLSRLIAQVSATTLTIYTECATGVTAPSYNVRYYLLNVSAK